MSENDLSKIVVDICFRIHKQYGRDYLKVFMRKYFAMNGAKLE